MWLVFAFISSLVVGCYDTFKKAAVDDNAVIPVLFLNALISSLICVPFVILSYTTDILDGTLFVVPHVDWTTHGYVSIKSLIVLISWITGYAAVKNLPLTITGSIKATQPVITLAGAMLLFGERLNLYQWTGILLSILSFYLLSSSSRKEGICFTHNKWIFYTVVSVILGAISGLYDKHLLHSFDVMTLQVWFNIYQLIMITPILLLRWYPHRKHTTPFRWKWSILCVSLFLTVADWIYYYALSFPDSMISIVSMIRRSSVIVTFIAGAIFFHEKNLKRKAFDLFLVLLGMIFLYLGTK
ncbi:MAG: DMT family transporter [Tannerella sp.]|jgi:transporter family protein|nr:DMT family transporter [Tannerella sp.]